MNDPIKYDSDTQIFTLTVTKELIGDLLCVMNIDPWEELGRILSEEVRTKYHEVRYPNDH